MLMVIQNLMFTCELHLTKVNNQTCKLMIDAYMIDNFILLAVFEKIPFADVTTRAFDQFLLRQTLSAMAW